MYDSSFIKCIFNRCGFPLKLNHALKAHYDYWDEFVKCWLRYKSGSLALNDIKGWSIPKFSQNGGSNDSTIDYLPEPWWGNNGMQPLQSVVINYNPGIATKSQGFGTIKLPVNLSYRDFITENVKAFTPYVKKTASYVNANNVTILPNATDWNYHNRAKPVFEALKCIGVPLADDGLENHLSIELVPWHSGSWSMVKDYAVQNANNIFEHCIKFAAEASRCILNNKLRNVVLVRTSLCEFMNLFRDYKTNILVPECDLVKCTRLDCSKYAVVNFLKSGFDDVRFVVMWQVKQLNRNNFSHCFDFVKILEHVI